MKPNTGYDVVDAILHAARRIRTTCDTALRESGLSLSAYKLMRTLEHSDRSMREVSDILLVSPRTVTDMIDSLEGRGLVVRRPHPADRRVTLLHLTEQGQRQLSVAATLADRSHAAAISSLDGPDQSTLRQLLDLVAPAGEPAPVGQPARVG
jgi:DNA-binding MarR family transcriptional regulator